MDIRLVWRVEGGHVMKRAVTSILIVLRRLAVKNRVKGVY